MAMRFAEMWSWQGTIGRAKYALIGVSAFALKYTRDRFVAGGVFGIATPCGQPRTGVFGRTTSFIEFTCAF